MNLRSVLSSLIPSRFRRRVKLALGLVDHESRLQNLKRCGYSPASVVDAGAYRGEWTATIGRVFPQAKVLLIEPQPTYAASLRSSRVLPPGSVVVECALGQDTGKVQLHLGESNSYLVNEASHQSVEVTLRSLDEVVAETKFGSPSLIKFDLQGSELAALKGSTVCLATTEVLCLELSLLRIGEVPLVHEILDYLTSVGFQLYDLFGQNYRPLDGALWQVDAYFVRRDSTLLSSRQWG